MVKSFTLEELANTVNGIVEGDKTFVIKGIAAFDKGGSNDICLAMTPEYISKIPESKSKAFIVSDSCGIKNVNFIIHPNPHAAFARILSIFHPINVKKKTADLQSAGKNFKADESVYVGPGVFLGDDVSLGKNVAVYPGCVIDDNVSIGDDSIIYGNVSIYKDTSIGNRVIIHSGSVIGSDGFGFASENGKWIKINHIGKVIIEDDVEIGASNTIDKGTFGNTIVGKGVKTDNQVHIAHNVEIGENTLLIAQSGIAGSTKIGKNCIVAGKAGISGHLEIGDNVIIGPMSGITSNIKSGSIISGLPQMPHRAWLKIQGIISRLPEMRKKISVLERKLKNLENSTDE